MGDPEGVSAAQHGGDGGGLDGRGLSELALADPRHQRLVKTKMSEAGHRPRGTRARHLDIVLLLEVDHLDPAQARDVWVLLVKVLGEGLILHFTVIDWRQRVNVSVLLWGDGISVSIIVNVVKLLRVQL